MSTNSREFFFAELRRIPNRRWPDDCPVCGLRMAFALTPDAPPTRVCPSGHVVTADDVIRPLAERL